MATDWTFKVSFTTDFDVDPDFIPVLEDQIQFALNETMILENLKVEAMPFG